MESKLALVTGTSRGIGPAVAEELLARGWEVLGLARGRAAVEHERYRHLAVDLADTESVEGLFGELAERGLLDERERIGIVNNAGVLDIEPVHELDLSNLVRSAAVNLCVPAWLVGWALRNAPAAAALRIVDLSSGAAQGPYPAWGAYCATKAALRMFDAVVALELEEFELHAGRDVAVFTYAPGVVATAMQEQIRGSDPSRFPRRERFIALHEEGRLADPAGPAAEIAEQLESDPDQRLTESRYGG
ncbi:MAG: SDR family NAD(P)-dependent oxidoreductase [Planctomycetota bacterium]